MTKMMKIATCAFGLLIVAGPAGAADRAPITRTEMKCIRGQGTIANGSGLAGQAGQAGQASWAGGGASRAPGTWGGQPIQQMQPNVVRRGSNPGNRI